MTKSEAVKKLWENPLYRAKQLEAHKGIIPPSWLGKKRGPQSPEHKAKTVINLINNNGKEHFAWKGDNVGYGALHDWVRLHLGKANHCDNKNCYYPRLNSLGKIMYKPKQYTWANISGEYKRDINDWHQLCQSCNKLDGIKIPLRFIEKFTNRRAFL